MIIDADKQLIFDVASALQAGSYNSPTGTYNEQNGTWTPQLYTNTFDSIETGYTVGLIPLFLLKLETWDIPAADLSAVIGAFGSIWSYIGTGEYTYFDPNDPFTKIHVVEQPNGIVYEFIKGTTKVGHAIDTNTNRIYDMGKVVLGEGSSLSETSFIYEGAGIIRINGGAGNDVITLGENDHETFYELSGGGGYDTYYLKHGMIYELTDSGANRIYIEDANGNYNSIGDLFKSSTAEIWYSADGSEQLFQNGNVWTMTFNDGTTISLGADFQSGDFGINLLDAPYAPETYNVVHITDYIGEDWTYEEYDYYGSPGNDKIYGGSGNDNVYEEQGYDHLIGGSGNDMVHTSGMEDTILEGNSGVDALFGGEGNDRLFCADYGEMEALIAAGETATSLPGTGDLADGGPGDNYIYGSDARDGMFGAGGNDLIVGGGGDDVIFGDSVIIGVGTSTSFWNWSVDIIAQGESVTVQFGNIPDVYTDLDYTGDDVIYGGTGNDFASGDRGSFQPIC